MDDDYKTKLLLAALRGNDYIREFLVDRFWDRYRFCYPGNYWAVMKERKFKGWSFQAPRDLYCTVNTVGEMVYLTEHPQDELERRIIGISGSVWKLNLNQVVDQLPLMLEGLHTEALRENLRLDAAGYANLRDYVKKIRAAIPEANTSLLQLVINEIRGMELPPPVPAEKVSPLGRYMVQQYVGGKMVRDETFQSAQGAVVWSQNHFEAFKDMKFRYFIQGVHGWLEAETLQEEPWLKLKRL